MRDGMHEILDAPAQSSLACDVSATLASSATRLATDALRILQVSTFDIAGGAEKVAWELFRSYRNQGYGSWLAVGHKRSADPEVFVIPRSPANVQAAGVRAAVTALGRAFDEYRGLEAFKYPGTWQLLNLSPRRPTIVHCHNLHHHYFDLRVLPWLSAQVPVILTLHDAWLLSGHCSHSFDCERWRTGCGRCPDLGIYPAIRRDATRQNWLRKRDVYACSRLRVATPSQWLMTKVQQSMLGPAIVESRVIPNGVDLSIFHPAPKPEVRNSLGISPDTKVLLFAATGVRSNPWKDYKGMRAAISEVGSRLGDDRVLWLAVGETAPPERIGQVEIRFVPYQTQPESMARYYQAADVYVHAALADTFPNTILEALACGLPVVATEVGGIPEQIHALRGRSEGVSTTTYGLDRATGVLVPPRDPHRLSTAIELLLRDELLRHRMGANASRDAGQRFDLRRQVDSYLSWYEELLPREECLA